MKLLQIKNMKEYRDFINIIFYDVSMFNSVEDFMKVFGIKDDGVLFDEKTGEPNFSEELPLEFLDNLLKERMAELNLNFPFLMLYNSNKHSSYDPDESGRGVNIMREFDASELISVSDFKLKVSDVDSLNEEFYNVVQADFDQIVITRDKQTREFIFNIIDFSGEELKEIVNADYELGLDLCKEYLAKLPLCGEI